MQAWTPLRNSRWEPEFEQSAAAAGLNWQTVDAITVEIDAVLLGVDRATLDREYPALVGDLRVYLVGPSRDCPALRVAFRLEQAHSDECICYIAVSAREEQSSL